jgi:hypothetical protein
MNKPCLRCGQPVSITAIACPHCRKREEEDSRRRLEEMQRQANDSAMNTALTLAIVPLLFDL